jgi:D-tyrosyl-tRNA(Tyr) deacylase
MRMLLQRVSSASVTVNGEVKGEIQKGLVVFLGVGLDDNREHAGYLLDKLLNLRIFEDDAGKMNRTVQDIDGGLLIVSQFTLYANIRHGRRPGFDQAAPPEMARKLYDYFVNSAKSRMVDVHTGIFQATMTVTLANEGPVSIFHDSIDKLMIKSHAVR